MPPFCLWAALETVSAAPDWTTRKESARAEGTYTWLEGLLIHSEVSGH